MRQLILLGIGFLLLLSVCASAQEQPAIVYDNSLAKPEHTKRFWQYSAEFSTRSKADTTNKVELFDTSITAFTSKFTNSGDKTEYSLESTAGFTNREQFDNHFYIFKASANRKFNHNFNLGAQSEFTFTRIKSFARTGIEFNKEFSSDQISVKPFSRVDFYFPLGSQSYGRDFNHRGVTWSNGVISNVAYKSFMFEDKTQFIIDSGAVITGQRTLFNNELFVGYRLNRMCIGPMFEYTRVLSASNSFAQHSRLSAGMFVRYQ